MSDSLNIVLDHSELVSSADKEHLRSQRGLVVRMTSYSGAGENTLAYRPEKNLYNIDTSKQTIEESLEVVFDDIFPLIST